MKTLVVTIYKDEKRKNNPSTSNVLITLPKKVIVNHLLFFHSCHRRFNELFDCFLWSFPDTQIISKAICSLAIGDSFSSYPGQCSDQVARERRRRLDERWRWGGRRRRRRECREKHIWVWLVASFSLCSFSVESFPGEQFVSLLCCVLGELWHIFYSECSYCSLIDSDISENK